MTHTQIEIETNMLIAEPSILFPELTTSHGRLPELVIPNPKNLPIGAKRYQIEERIGSGGFGQVFRAREGGLGRSVAIKILNISSSPSAASQMLREGIIQARLEHQNIIPIYDYGETPAEWSAHEIPEGQLFVVMKLVEGKTLGSYIADNKKPHQANTFQRLRLFLEICHAISFANNCNVIHRDLKPGNIMIENKTGNVFVLDWGLSKIKSFADHLNEGTIAGTPAYMSPEQVTGREIDHRSDIYSLGTILYELLTGLSPFFFSDNNYETYKHKILNEEPALMNKIKPLELRAVIQKAMTKNPDNRYQNIAEMIDVIEKMLNGETAKERAKEKLVEASCLKKLLKKLQQQHGQYRIRLNKLRTTIPPWKPLKEKSKIIRLENFCRAFKQVIAALNADYIATLTQVLLDDAENDKAHLLLADHYKIEFIEAEQSGNKDKMALAEKFMREHDHCNRFTAFLAGNSILDLNSPSPNARIKIYRFIEYNRRLAPLFYPLPSYADNIIPTRFSLPIGSYLILVKASGHRIIRYPINITRLQKWEGLINFYADNQINPDRIPSNYFAYIPAGQFISGGDSHSPGCKELTTLKADDFFIARYPVTCKEYLAFINSTLTIKYSDNINELLPHDEDGDPLWLFDEDSKKFMMPMPDHDLLPVTGISWHNANAYCKWLSQLIGIQFSLPDEWSWEKAATGVDGRRQPWGNADEPTFANLWDSCPPGNAKLLPIDKIPRQDTSIYGVRGCAGGVREFTNSFANGATDKVITRGGCWRYDSDIAATKVRTVADKTEKTCGTLGFRICHKPC
ncbi:MAG: bifunctional serine/threonine-protein kinase/formylglycine-generating enzyme family protein [bacterium]|nr:bifunctional serine/threonine-protein kinase/formylglycine-generating enzyme family protein [bacterium]